VIQNIRWKFSVELPTSFISMGSLSMFLSQTLVAMFGERRRKTNNLGSTFKSMWSTTDRAQIIWSNQKEGLLLSYNGTWLHYLYKEAWALLVPCQFYSSTTKTTPSDCSILAIWGMGNWCSEPYCSKVICWPFVYPGNNRLLFQMGRSNPDIVIKKR